MSLHTDNVQFTYGTYDDWWIAHEVLLTIYIQSIWNIMNWSRNYSRTPLAGCQLQGPGRARSWCPTICSVAGCPARRKPFLAHGISAVALFQLHKNLHSQVQHWHCLTGGSLPKLKWLEQHKALEIEFFARKCSWMICIYPT